MVTAAPTARVIHQPVAGGPKASAKIRIESKEDIRKRLGRSTDAGDAVVQACSLPLLDRRAPYVLLEIDQRQSDWR